MARYALAGHVFVCVNGEHLVLLDLKEDRYWALDAAQTAGLALLVPGWPVKGAASDSGEAVPEAAGVVEVLQSRGILLDGIPPGKDATPVRAVPPVHELISEIDGTSETERSAGASQGNWFTFFAAAAFAKFAMRTWPFERVIARVRRRKERVGTQSGKLDAERARRLVEAFGRYRIFMFSSKNECLYDSFALVEFLHRYRIYPDWVFGVQARPFAAHCWVQHGDIVFNDTVEHVSGYTPIMVV
jgi:Transglutaminase-like superfamily